MSNVTTGELSGSLSDDPKKSGLLGRFSAKLQDAVQQGRADDPLRKPTESLAREAALPAEALEKSAQYGDQIDVLVTDVVMPGMNGLELAKRIREQNPNVRVVMISGYPDSVIADRGTMDPDVRLLQKPVATNVLLAAVQAALEGP